MFLFDEELTPAQYLATMPGMAAVRPTLIRVRPLDSVRVHRAKTSLLNCNSLLLAEIEQRAREYWGGLQAPELDSEILLVGDIEVVEVIGTP